MAFTPAFTTSQTLGNPNIVNYADSSTGSDASITQRRVFLIDAEGSYLVPTGTSTSYIQWALVNTSIAINVLTVDMCLSVLVQWLDVNNAVLYSSTQLCVYTLYSENFYYGLTQNQTTTPNIVNDINYYFNKMVLRCSIDEANNATLYGIDQFSAQSALDRAQALIDNPNAF